MHRTTILDNGITVITSPVPSAKTAVVYAGINVGTHFEDDTQRGLAHFLEHMVSNGTKKFPTQQDVINAVNIKGIEKNAYTNYMSTLYHCKGHHKDINTILEVTNEVFQHPTFPENYLKKEKGTITQEIKKADDAHGIKARNIVWSYLYEREPISYPTLGTIESISAFSRDDLIRFHEKYYVAENTIISVAGNIDEQEVIETIKKLYADMPHGEKAQFKKPTAKPIEKPHHSLVRKDNSQVNILIAFRSCSSKAADYLILLVMELIMAGGHGSRLYQRLRNQMGACYVVRSFNISFPNLGIYHIATGVQDVMVEKVIEAIAEELGKLKTEIVSEEELNKAKKKIITNKAFDIESMGYIAEFNIRNFIQTGKTQEYEDFVKEIEKVSAEDVQRVAKDIFRGDNVVVSYVGNINVPESYSQPLLQL